MKIDESTYGLLESYILGELAPKEVKALEKKLANDSELKTEMEFIRIFISESKAEFSQNNEETKSKGSSTKVLFSKKYWLLAASVILICTIAFFLWPRPSTGQKLFKEYFRPDPRADFSMSPAPENKLFKKACIEYRTHHFQNAINLFQDFLKTSPQNFEAKYFMANAYLAEEKIKKAMEIFQGIEKEAPAKFSADIEWYKALSMLYLEDFVSSKEILSGISKDPNNIYHPKARSLLLQIPESNP